MGANMRTPNEITLRRLAFVKHLHSLAVKQSLLAEPIRFASLLTMHDTVELFLCIACEHLDTGKKELRFMEYWDVLSTKLESPGLTQKEAMRRLNQARVDFKHFGLMPSQIDFDGFRVTATLFLEENTPTIFGRGFDSISLVDLIESAAARESLRNAERQLGQDQTKESVASSKIAFEQILEEHGRKRSGLLGPNWQGNIQAVRDLTRYTNIQDLEYHARGNSALEHFVDIIVRAVEALEDRVELLSLGIDGQRYSEFHWITPPVWKNGTDYHVDKRWQQQAFNVSKGRAKWCMDFVIETALILQSVDRVV
jgi:hypothetical protein